MALSKKPAENYLLQAIPAGAWSRFAPFLETENFTLGQVLYSPGGHQQYAYFPLDCIISLLYVMENGDSAEIAIVGNEGLVGTSLFMGGESVPNHAVVQSAGRACRMPARYVREEFLRAGPVQHLFLRYTQALIAQMGQTAVCNRHHSVDQQLCRWILMSLDRLPSNQITMTQELIANMLGVRREGVTEAARKLQRAGIIDYSRGHITVISRPKLEARVCECYEVVRQAFAELLPRNNKSKRRNE